MEAADGWDSALAQLVLRLPEVLVLVLACRWVGLDHEATASRSVVGSKG